MAHGNGQGQGVASIASGSRLPGGRAASAEARERWRSARRFQMAVQRTLGVPFVQWLLLESLAELLAERTGPVSQVAVAERAGVSDKVTSYWMILSAEAGLVDREPDEDGRAYEVLLSTAGERALERWNETIRCRGIVGGAAGR